MLEEIGYRAVRTSYPHNNSTLVSNEFDLNAILWNRRLGELRCFDSVSIDTGSATGGTVGLYDWWTSDHAVGMLGLDLGWDIIDVWDTDRVVAARRAYRRMIGWLTHVWLMCGGGVELMAFHPPSLTCADVNDPLRRFDVSDPALRFNLLVELFENMAVVVQLLSDYVEFGSVSDLIEAQARYLS